MQNFHIKSLILGIGIGIVLTSVVSMIYMAGYQPKMSREDVIREAEKYGMVQKTEILKVQTGQPERKNEPQKPPEVNVKTIENKESVAVEQKNTEARQTQSDRPTEGDLKISVNKGDTSELVADKLLKAGMIADKAAFIKELSAMGLATEIDVGEFKLKIGMDNKTIIKILARR